MPDFSTPCGTTNDNIPDTRAADVHKSPLTKQFANAAALAAAVAKEVTRIAAGLGLWLDGERLIVVSEPVGTAHLWSATAQNALSGKLPNGVPFTLGSSSNTVTEVSAFPSGGIDGNLAYNPAGGGVTYLRASGSWSNLNGVSIAADTTLSSAHLGKTLLVNSGSLVTLTVPSTLGFDGAAAIVVRRLGAGAVTIAAGSSATIHEATTGAATGLPRYATTVLTCIAAGEWTVEA